MPDRDDFYVSGRFEEPLAAVEREKRRLDEVGEVWKTESTTVQAKDKSFTMTFDGRGDLSGLTFNGTRYRSLAPAELANLILTTVQAGRMQSIEKVAAIMAESMPGLDFVGLATGTADVGKVLDSLVAPLLDGLDSAADLARPAAPARPAARSDWES